MTLWDGGGRPVRPSSGWGAGLTAGRRRFRKGREPRVLCCGHGREPRRRRWRIAEAAV